MDNSPRRFKYVTAYMDYKGQQSWRGRVRRNGKWWSAGYFPFTPQGEERAQQAVHLLLKQLEK